MKKPCSDCPFVKKNPLQGSPAWLKDVVTMHREDPYFHHTCHKTDPKADGFSGAKKVRSCVGHTTMIMNDLDETPGHGGVWESISEMGLAYIGHYESELRRRGRIP